MRILRTRPDPTRAPEERGEPPHLRQHRDPLVGRLAALRQLAEAQRQVRAGEGGKLRIDDDGLLPLDLLRGRRPDEPGCWLGLALLHTLFTREHNAICDRLRAAYPTWSDDELFEHARLVNAALLAKIHTVEWTTGDPRPSDDADRRCAPTGGASPASASAGSFGRLSDSEVISGIVGGPTDHFGVPYSITEEFVAVYRMHPLLPDDFTFRSVGRRPRCSPSAPSRNSPGRTRWRCWPSVALPDLFYSFGIAHPGAMPLHNFPRFLQRFERPDGIVQSTWRPPTSCAAASWACRATPTSASCCTCRRSTSFEELTDNPALARGDCAASTTTARPRRPDGRHVRRAAAARLRLQRHRVPDLRPDGLAAAQQRPLLHGRLHAARLHAGGDRPGSPTTT